MQAVRGYQVQGCVVQHHHAVRILSQPLKCEERVVGLDHHVAHLVLVGKHRVGLHQLLGVPVIQPFQEVGAQARACPPSDGVTQHEALQTVTAIRLPVYDVKDVLVDLLSLGESTGPVVASSSSVLSQVDVLRVVELGVGGVEDGVDHPGLQVQQHGPRDVVLIIGLVEKDVLAVRALGGELLHDALGADTMLGAQLFPELEPNLIAALAQL